MDDYEALINEIRMNRNDRESYRVDLLESNKHIEDLLKKILVKNSKIVEQYLVTGNTITKGEYYEVPPVQSDGLERARIFMSIGFNEATTGGITVDLYYAGHRIGEIMSVGPTEAGMSAGSEPFDINQLSGFNLIIRNHDVGQSVKINSLKAVLYNE